MTPLPTPLLAAEFLGTGLDYAVILIYFVAVLGFGLFFARYTRSTKDFFFGGQRFAWWLIAFSCVATTVGSYSFIKYSAAGYTYGVCSTQSYLNDWFWMPLLLLVWLPIIYYRRVASIPEYFQVRFGRATRVAATAIILLYLVGYIGINLYTLGQALGTLLGWPLMTGATVTAVAVALYVYAGGQTAVIMTDLAQGIILLIAGIGLFLAGVWHLGGFGNFWSLLPEGHRYAFSEFSHPDKFSFIGIYAQDGLANTGAFMLMNQGIIMRFLSLKSVKDARRMAVCWILVLAPLAAVATSGGGWIARALAENGELVTEPKDSFVNVAHFLCSPGVFGFVLAALTAALMSTADTLVNATSAIFVNDIWKPFVSPHGSDRSHLRVARIASLCAAGLGLALVPLFAQNKSIYQAHGMFTAAVTPPIVMAILFGSLWKRYTPAAAFATLVGGGALVALSFVWPDALIKPFAFGMGPDSYKFMRALYGLAVCGVLGVVVGLLTKPRPLEEIAGLVTGTQLEAMRLFKGGEVNRRPGKKARVTIQIDPELGDSDVVSVPQAALDTMAAEPGDMLYLCDTRWWLGGLRSVHARAGEPQATESLIMGTEAAATAHFTDGETVLVEKLL
ncbi:sodium/solute symporter [bacterium]|nr:sodium/solute symporter [bacterium]